MTHFMPTFVNVIAVVVGSLAGLYLQNYLQERFRTIIFQVLGLITIAIGLKDALNSQDFPAIALSLIFGAIIGEALNTEYKLVQLGKSLSNVSNSKSPQFVDGFLTSSILFCVGGMTIVGSLKAGTDGNGDLLYTKALLDGHAALFLAGTMGSGVLFSALTVLLVQGALTGIFIFAGSYVSEAMITEITALGGLLIAAIGFKLLGMESIRTGNLLPGLVILPVLYWIQEIVY